MPFRNPKDFNIGFSASSQYNITENDIQTLTTTWQEHLSTKKAPGDLAGSLAPSLGASSLSSQKDVPEGVSARLHRDECWSEKVYLKIVGCMTFQLFDL
jgi:hypothetical protein